MFNVSTSSIWPCTDSLIKHHCILCSLSPLVPSGPAQTDLSDFTAFYVHCTYYFYLCMQSYTAFCVHCLHQVKSDHTVLIKHHCIIKSAFCILYGSAILIKKIDTAVSLHFMFTVSITNIWPCTVLISRKSRRVLENLGKVSKCPMTIDMLSVHQKAGNHQRY